jgi:hypothetical protein
LVDTVGDLLGVDSDDPRPVADPADEVVGHSADDPVDEPV